MNIFGIFYLGYNTKKQITNPKSQIISNDQKTKPIFSIRSSRVGLRAILKSIDSAWQAQWPALLIALESFVGAAFQPR
jgi:hypothetical protein